MNPTGDIRIRPAREVDVELLFGLILELASYEKLTAAVRGDAEVLRLEGEGLRQLGAARAR